MNNNNPAHADIDGFSSMFYKACEYHPYSYQCRLACGDGADLERPETLTQGRPCESLLINVPTGLGKTAAVVFAWLWNRIIYPDAQHPWPRRLIYCLPMRTLVEQTRDNLLTWLKNLAAVSSSNLDLQRLAAHSPITLMGGEDLESAHRAWDIHPERPAILIGTQDMLLSRALNRGYGLSPYRWPIQFGLLNNDCLWVFDEVQLMGNGLATGIQLDAFRGGLWPVAKPCMSWWMSATNSAGVFATRDRTDLEIASPRAFSLTDKERSSQELEQRLKAHKKLELLAKPPKATDVINQHQAGRLSLVVVNTVGSALQWHAELETQLEKLRGAKRGSAAPRPTTILLHSRFRRDDRKKQMEVFKFLQESGSKSNDNPGFIVVATQVLEAGIDLSAAALWSEIAPWASVIQRLGRLNRDGKQPDAIGKFWFPKSSAEKNEKNSPNAGRIGPYEKLALKDAEELLRAVLTKQDQGESYRAALDVVLATEASQQALKFLVPAVIRPDDVHGLFSVERDLAGGFTNIAPFVRTTDMSSDVLIYWRSFKGKPLPSIGDAVAREMVRIPSYILGSFLAEHKKTAFLWNDEDERWDSISDRQVVPGMTLLLSADTGGYSCELGWTGNPKDKAEILNILPRGHNSLFSDRDSEVSWQLLNEHTAAVTTASAVLTRELDLTEELQSTFVAAAKWHDTGKGHRLWQQTLPSPPAGRVGPWGKFSGEFVKIPRVRHEAFSLLAAWQSMLAGNTELNALALYLIASHHGKVRTVLRSVRGGDNFFGWRADDEPLLVEGEPPCRVDLSVRHFAGAGQIDWPSHSFEPKRPSWIAIVEELLGFPWRDDIVPRTAIPDDQPRELGVFKLSFLEAVFRAADARASRGDFSSAQS
jgi:CRISPR-associated endonuclease/helicase Cas3